MMQQINKQLPTAAMLLLSSWMMTLPVFDVEMSDSELENVGKMGAKMACLMAIPMMLTHFMMGAGNLHDRAKHALYHSLFVLRSALPDHHSPEFRMKWTSLLHDVALFSIALGRMEGEETPPMPSSMDQKMVMAHSGKQWDEFLCHLTNMSIATLGARTIRFVAEIPGALKKSCDAQKDAPTSPYAGDTAFPPFFHDNSCTSESDLEPTELDNFAP